jgi:AAA domain/Toprim domain
VTGTAFERVLDKLTANGCKVRMTGEGRAMAQCPGHDDGSPSLSVTRIEGSVLLHCFGGCDVDQVLDKLGMGKRDLFDDHRGADYRYAYLNGALNRTVQRRYDSSGKKTFPQPIINGDPILLRLAKVVDAVAAGRVVHLVEGEHDVLALEAIGAVATTAPQGALNFDKVDASPLHGANVVAVVDKDKGGQGWAGQVRAKLDGQARSLTFVQAAEGKDAADHVAAGHDASDFQPLDLDQDATDRAKALFPALDWHALWADDTEEEWIHDPLLPARRSVTIYSAPKVGKSLLILEFAVAISRGEKFLDFTPTRRLRVLYVDFENDPRGDIRSRLQAMGYKPDDLDHLDLLSFPSMAGLDSERGALELLEAVKAYKSEVVVIDTVSRSVDGKENENDTWLWFYRYTGLALKRAGVAMIRLDHPGKDEAKGTRGGSAKSGDPDAIWKLSRVTEDRFRLECTDSRMSLSTKSLHLTRHTIPRLHHTVNAISAVTDFQAKVNALIALLDSNEIPAHANRDTVRDFASSRGTKAAGKVIQEVVKRRKDAAPAELLPEFTPSESPLNSGTSSPRRADHPKHRDLSTEQVNSGTEVQGSSPAHGTTELRGSSLKTAPGSSPVQAGTKCPLCPTGTAPPGRGICPACDDRTRSAS